MFNTYGEEGEQRAGRVLGTPRERSSTQAARETVCLVSLQSNQEQRGFGREDMLDSSKASAGSAAQAGKVFYFF